MSRQQQLCRPPTRLWLQRHGVELTGEFRKPRRDELFCPCMSSTGDGRNYMVRPNGKPTPARPGFAPWPETLDGKRWIVVRKQEKMSEQVSESKSEDSNIKEIHTMAKILDLTKKKQIDATEISVQLTGAQVGFLFSLITNNSVYATADLLVSHAKGKKQADGSYRVEARAPNCDTFTVRSGDVVGSLYSRLTRAISGFSLTDPMKEDVQPSSTSIGGNTASYPGYGSTITVGCESNITASEIKQIETAVEDVVKQLNNIASIDTAIVDTLTLRSRLVQVDFNRHGTTKINIAGLNPDTLENYRKFFAWTKKVLAAG